MGRSKRQKNGSFSASALALAPCTCVKRVTESTPRRDCGGGAHGNEKGLDDDNNDDNDHDYDYDYDYDYDDDDKDDKNGGDVDTTDEIPLPEALLVGNEYGEDTGGLGCGGTKKSRRKRARLQRRRAWKRRARRKEDVTQVAAKTTTNTTTSVTKTTDTDTSTDTERRTSFRTDCNDGKDEGVIGKRCGDGKGSDNVCSSNCRGVEGAVVAAAAESFPVAAETKHGLAKEREKQLLPADSNAVVAGQDSDGEGDGDGDGNGRRRQGPTRRCAASDSPRPGGGEIPIVRLSNLSSSSSSSRRLEDDNQEQQRQRHRRRQRRRRRLCGGDWYDQVIRKGAGGGGGGGRGRGRGRGGGIGGVVSSWLKNVQWVSAGHDDDENKDDDDNYDYEYDDYDNVDDKDGPVATDKDAGMDVNAETDATMELRPEGSPVAAAVGDAGPDEERDANHGAAGVTGLGCVDASKSSAAATTTTTTTTEEESGKVKDKDKEEANDASIDRSSRDESAVATTTALSSSSSSERGCPYCRSNSDRARENNRLYRELCDIKARLWPEAENCARMRDELERLYRTAQDDGENDDDDDDDGDDRNIIEVEDGKGDGDGDGDDDDNDEDEENDENEKKNNVRHVFNSARGACNPFEILGEGRSGGLNKMFVNRSAMKLANLDALLGFTLTHSIRGGVVVDGAGVNKRRRGGSDGNCGSDEDGDGGGGDDGRNGDGDRDGGGDERFVFVDLCGAPGGFSEYVLYRHRKWPAGQHDDADADTAARRRACRGYGMSLACTNEHGSGLAWKVADGRRSNTSSSSSLSDASSFHIFYGADGTGDIYNWDNILALRDEIAKLEGNYGGNFPLSRDDVDRENDCCGNGNDECNQRNDDCRRRRRRRRCRDSTLAWANLVLADGGFDAQRDSDRQEELGHKMAACQSAAALLLLRKGGMFIMKLFGSRTCQTRRLIQSLSRKFEKISLVKPVVSRPASAERYLVCYSFRGGKDGWDGSRWKDEMVLDCARWHCLCRCRGRRRPPPTPPPPPPPPLADPCRAGGGKGGGDGDGKNKSDDIVPSSTYSSLSSSSCYYSIFDYLDEVEGDILKLNIKTCLAILSCLKTKARDWPLGLTSKAFVLQSRDRVNVKKYSDAWYIK